MKLVNGTTSASRNERGLRAEVAEQQVLGNAGRLGNLASRRAAVVLTREQFASRVEKQPTRLPLGRRVPVVVDFVVVAIR